MNETGFVAIDYFNDHSGRWPPCLRAAELDEEGIDGLVIILRVLFQVSDVRGDGPKLLSHHQAFDLRPRIDELII